MDYWEYDLSGGCVCADETTRHNFRCRELASGWRCVE
jgi:hypothetical protein